MNRCVFKQLQNLVSIPDYVRCNKTVGFLYKLAAMDLMTNLDRALNT